MMGFRGRVDWASKRQREAERYRQETLVVRDTRWRANVKIMLRVVATTVVLAGGGAVFHAVQSATKPTESPDRVLCPPVANSDQRERPLRPSADRRE